MVLVGNIVALRYSHVNILVALVLEVLLCERFSAVYHVRRNLSALYDTKLVLHILAFRLLQTDVIDGRDTRTQSQLDMQISLVTYNRVYSDGHIREQSMPPVTLHGIRNVASRYGGFLSDAQS